MHDRNVFYLYRIIIKQRDLILTLLSSTNPLNHPQLEHSTSTYRTLPGDRQTQTPQPRRKWRNTKRYATMGPGERRTRDESSRAPIAADARDRHQREHSARQAGSDSSLATGSPSATVATKDAASCAPRNSQSTASMKDLYAEVDKHVLGPATYCTVTSV